MTGSAGEQQLVPHPHQPRLVEILPVTEVIATLLDIAGPRGDNARGGH